MKKSNSRLIDVMITVFVACFIGMLSGASFILTAKYENKIKGNASASNLDEITKMYEKIVDEYYGTIDEDTLTEAALSGMLSVLDANSSYLDRNSTASFNNKMKGEYYGVGIEALTLEDTGLLVVSVLKDTPAEKAGIKEGDIIIEANSISLKDKTATYFTSLVSNLIDNIKIKIMRDNEKLDFTLNAEKIVISSVTTNTFYKNYKKVGYIKISIFALNTASQFSTKLKELESSGIDSLIIDVRDNAGGYLSNVATILELFMKKDSVLYKIETKDVTSDRKDNTEDYRDYKVVVLVNGSSASASEILAACFKENYGGELVGTTTYGKGTVQETINLSGDTMAKITTKKWLTPTGEWINEVGIEPTIQVNINDKYLTNPIFDNDNQLEKALDIITR